MDEPRAVIAAESRQALLMMDECIHKSARGVPVPWMDDEAGWLIDNEQIVILVDDIERDILPYKV